MSDPAPWITYRPELRVFDCTIRDGGLINCDRRDDFTAFFDKLNADV